MSNVKDNELDKYRDIIIAGIDYMIKCYSSAPIETHDGKLVNFAEELGSYFSNLKNHVVLLHQKNRLTSLKKIFRDISEPAIASNDMNYQTFIEEETGHKIGLVDKLLSKIDTIIKTGQIKTDTQYRDIATLIDFLESYNPPDKKRIEKLLALQFAYMTKKNLRIVQKK